MYHFSRNKHQVSAIIMGILIIIFLSAFNAFGWQSTYESIIWEPRENDTFYCLDIYSHDFSELWIRAIQCGEDFHQWSAKTFIESKLGMTEGLPVGFQFAWKVWSASGYGGEGFQGLVTVEPVCQGLPYLSTIDSIQWGCRNNDTQYCIDILDRKWNMLYQAAMCGERLHSYSPSNSLPLVPGKDYHWKVWSPSAVAYWGYQEGFEGAFDVPSDYVGNIWIDKVTGMEFVRVKGGCYDMGCGYWTNGCELDETPVHNVCVDKFWIGKYEVTIDEYRQFLLETGDESGVAFDYKDCPVNKDSAYSLSGNRFGLDGRQPMIEVSWNGAKAFADWLSAKTKYASYRLPTEAEWEYAARNRGTNDKYPGSDDLNSVAWYGEPLTGSTHTTGTKLPNGLDLYDMSGNVWEWCLDLYDSGYYSASPVDNPSGPSSTSGSSATSATSATSVTSADSYRILRGGGWHNTAVDCRLSNREYYLPTYQYVNIGFRLVCFPTRQNNEVNTP